MPISDDRTKTPDLPSTVRALSEEEREKRHERAVKQMQGSPGWAASRKTILERAKRIQAARMVHNETSGAEQAFDHALSREDEKASPVSASRGLSSPSVLSYVSCSEDSDSIRRSLQDPRIAHIDWCAFKRTGRLEALGDEQHAGVKASGAREAMDWARARELILDPIPLSAGLERIEETYGGMEHHVFHDKQSGRVVKIAQDEFYGIHTPLNFGKYLERWALANEVFGDEAMFHGFTQILGEPFFCIVVSNPFVEGREGTEAAEDRAAIDESMRTLGFYIDGRGASYTNPDKKLRVSDARGANFIIRPDGSAFPIDVHVERLSSLREDSGQGDLFAD